MRFHVFFNILLITISVGCSQKGIISPPIKNLPEKSINSQWIDQEISQKISLILHDALPKIINDRNVLYRWDINNGEAKVSNTFKIDLLDSVLIKNISENVNLILTNKRDKLPYKRKLDCLTGNERFNYKFVPIDKKYDILVSPEVILENEKIRVIKIRITNAEFWIVKIKYKLNWNNDCYTTEVISKNIIMY
jgi:hypothetical protein